MEKTNIVEQNDFPKKIYQKLKLISPAVGQLELYEFIYALENFLPEAGWESIHMKEMNEIEATISNAGFYENIHLKDKENGQIKLDEQITLLTQMLFVGLVNGSYSRDWVNKNFYFDVRGFYFLVRTNYFTETVKSI